MKYRHELLESRCFGLGSYAYYDTQTSDGRVFIAVPAETPYGLYSPDRGLTWERVDLKGRRKQAEFRQLRDGSFISLAFDNIVYDSLYDLEQRNVPYCLAIYRAESLQQIMDNKATTSYALFETPGLSTGFGDSGNGHAGCSVRLIELSNGDLLATMYGQFESDRTLCPYFAAKRNYRFYLYRTWCIVSHDKGRTWEFLSTIADCQTHPIRDVNAEGYCEADCFEVEPNHIVCVLRTGGHEVVSPLYCAHSYDAGRTWGAPYEINGWGVMPRLMRMQNGALVCSSGHRHTFLLFSEDNGRTWSEPCILERCDGEWGYSCSGYNTIMETQPGELTVVFDDPKARLAEGYQPGNVRQVYANRYRISKQPEGGEAVSTLLA